MIPRRAPHDPSAPRVLDDCPTEAVVEHTVRVADRGAPTTAVVLANRRHADALRIAIGVLSRPAVSITLPGGVQVTRDLQQLLGLVVEGLREAGR